MPNTVVRWPFTVRRVKEAALEHVSSTHLRVVWCQSMGAPIIRYEILQLAYLQSKISCAVPKFPDWQFGNCRFRAGIWSEGCEIIATFDIGWCATSRKTTSRPCFFHSSDTQFELRHGRRCLCQLWPRDCHTKFSWKSVCPKTHLYGTLLRAILASHRTLLGENMASNTSSCKSI